MKKFIQILSTLILTVTLLTSCGSSSNSIFINLLIVVEPAIAVYDIGVKAQYKAYALRFDESWVEVTEKVEWTTGDPAVADISESGLLTALAVGETKVFASVENSSSDALAIVEDKSPVKLIIEPVDKTIPKGYSVDYRALAIYGDDTRDDVTEQTLWSSSNTDAATISSSGADIGRAYAVGVGITDISAQFDGLTQSTSLTVSEATLEKIQVSPALADAPKGTTQQYIATGIFSDDSFKIITDEVTWESSDPAVATVSNTDPGLAEALAEGETTISASRSGISGTAQLTVSPASVTSVQIIPSVVSLPKGTLRKLTAIAFYTDNSHENVSVKATWTSTNPDVVAIGVGERFGGLIRGLSEGRATITAYFENKEGAAAVTVTPAELREIQVSPTLANKPVGTTQQYTATGIYSDDTFKDITTEVTWQSSEPEFATISNTEHGLAEALAEGEATISASLSGKTGTATLTVSPATITSVQVTPADVSVPKGTVGQFTATAYYTDNTHENVTAVTTWTSSDPLVVAIATGGEFAGRATALSEGSATITAYFDNEEGTAAVTVTEEVLIEIQISPTITDKPVSTTLQYTATGIYSNASNEDITTEVTWQSSVPAVATVSNIEHGLAETLTKGETTISASLTGITGTALLTVTEPVLESIQVTPAVESIPKGTVRQFTATAFYNNNTSDDVTSQATWTSSDPAVVAIETGGEFAGQATGLSVSAAGESETITANFEGQTGTANVTVTAATLDEIQVSPALVNTPIGTTQQYTATGIYSDASNQDITTEVTWQSSVPEFATISNAEHGLAEALAVDETTGIGETTISASLSEKTGTALLTVTEPVLESIQVTPAEESIPKGTVRQFTATAFYDNNTSDDVTSQATWTSSNTLVVVIETGGEFGGQATGISEGNATIAASFEGQAGTADVTVTAATLNEIQISPAIADKPIGSTQQYTATGIYSDASNQDITNEVTWQSSAPEVATISNTEHGLAEALSIGETDISASLSGKTGTAMLTVTNPILESIQVTPAAVSIPKGTVSQFTATAFYNNNTSNDVTSQATWTSSNTLLVVIETGGENGGQATGLSEGNATITANFEGKVDTADVTVTAATLNEIQVSPAIVDKPIGTTQQYTATGIYSDDSNQDITNEVTWQSSVPEVATVSNTEHGLAEAIAVGETDISASLSGKTGAAVLTVTDPILESIQVTPTTVSIPKGTVRQFTATAYYNNNTSNDVTSQATWTSSNTTAVVIETGGENGGQATALSEGYSTVTASFEGQAGTADVTVTAATLYEIQVSPATAIKPVGTTQQYTATGIYSDDSNLDITNEVTWQSAEPTVATVSNAEQEHGLAEALSIGDTDITASLSGKTGTAVLTVTEPTLESIQVTPVTVSMPKGTVKQFTATAYYNNDTYDDVTSQATWTSSNTTAVVIETGGESAGQATGLSEGIATIKAVFESEAGYAEVTVTEATLDQIQVSPATASKPVGTTLQYTATGIYSDNSNQDITTEVAWQSSVPAVATISNTEHGLAEALAVGETTISASLSGKTGTALLTVTEPNLESIQVTPVTVSMPKGTVRQFTATAYYDNNTSNDVTSQATWTSSNTTAVVIETGGESAGQATGLSEGIATIKAVFESEAGYAEVTVTEATLDEIEVSPAIANTPVGTTLQYTATGIYSDDSNLDITNEVTWQSTEPTVATVSNAEQEHGLAEALSIGDTDITASLSGKTGTAVLNVSEATVTSIQVTPADVSVPNGSIGSFTATAFYSDNTNRDVTAEATWTSSDPEVVAIETGGESPGQATALSVGSATIKAIFENQEGYANITVTDAELTEIQAAPINETIPNGSEQQYIATGIYSDDTKKDITNEVTWQSSEPAVATISSIEPGLAEALEVGLTEISASLQDITSPTGLLVSDAELLGIVVLCDDDEILILTTTQCTALGYFTNRIEDITREATWFSSDENIVYVSNLTETKGMIIGLGNGNANVHAKYAPPDQAEETSNQVNIVVTGDIESLTVTPADAVIAVDTSQQYMATALLSSGEPFDVTDIVTWQSSNPSIATIGNQSDATNPADIKGNAIGVTAGITTISATLNLPGVSYSASEDLTVEDNSLSSITVSCWKLDINIKQSSKCSALADYNGIEIDITAEATWQSSDTDVAQIGILRPEGRQEVEGVGLGSSEITATYEGVTSDPVVIDVTGTFIRLSLESPIGDFILRSSEPWEEYVCIEEYIDENDILQRVDVTDIAQWTSTNIAVAEVGENIDSLQRVYGISAGASVITCLYEDASTSRLLIVLE